MSRFVPAIVLTVIGLGCSHPPDIPTIMGQWIWSETDREVFARTRSVHPAVSAGVWVGTIGVTEGTVRQRLALEPVVDRLDAPAIVVRFDDTFNTVWRLHHSDDAIAELVGERLAVLLEHVEKSGVRPAEVQLDYDSPVRLLPRWGNVVRTLTGGVLAGRDVWVTSLVAHVRDPEYGAFFARGPVGHVLQVFDTGDRANQATVDEILGLVGKHRLMFRLGVGAFERTWEDGGTDHRAWFAAVAELARSPWYRGLWVFPGGNQWASLVDVAP